MGRWVDRDSDSDRLPTGFERIHYDADTQQYTFLEKHTGKYYQSAPGNRYGHLQPIASSSSAARTAREASTAARDVDGQNEANKKDMRESARALLPFALLVLIVLLLLFRYVNSAGETEVEQVHCGNGFDSIQVQKGQTCWEIGETYGLGVEELLNVEGNEDIVCEKLRVGQGICVPVV
ncbi:hypothetical protein B0J11DRAFT_576126 [Dendryphion nanum]|uniref:LysM domain-containing protein n=1 Tax=Dendryphion nanum TaxID=256645 RepID=A0A9P9IYX5_9PLEO|nr:hypothetical protein B0J11DRAFT_576126 [Dendryphion nanum]